MCQRGGEQWAKKVVAAVIVGIGAREPVKLLGERVRGRFAARLGDAGEGCHPIDRQLRVIVEGRRQIGIACKHQGQEIVSLEWQLKELVDIEGGGIARHVPCEFRPQAVAAQQPMIGQLDRRPVEAGAASVGMYGLERMGHRLDLGYSASGVVEPSSGFELLAQLGSLGSQNAWFNVVALELLELVVQTRRQEFGDRAPQIRNALGVRDPHASTSEGGSSEIWCECSSKAVI